MALQAGPSSSMSRQGSHVAIAVQGSEQVDISAQTGLTAGPAPTGTLRLRGGPRDRPHVVWGEDVVDNEGLGRKKSKSALHQLRGKIDRGRLTRHFYFIF
jgi:protein phosphatase 1 regulatory subunit 11